MKHAIGTPTGHLVRRKHTYKEKSLFDHPDSSFHCELSFVVRDNNKRHPQNPCS
jgi:hypothetical protein